LKDDNEKCESQVIAKDFVEEIIIADQLDEVAKAYELRIGYSVPLDQ
jgi:hypothetical protein